MDAELVCNCRNCRKLLTTGQAWVTSCSHVFCYADGEKLIANEKKCPVCNHQFTGKMDLVRFDLNPSEAYKSMVLCGQKPDVVLDVCNRAIAFWNFQMRQETLYREYESKKSKALSAELQTTKVELKEVKTKFTEVNSLLREKNKNLQK
uniref:Uncharacterized protein n=1 Tax=Ciona savignyi TaxID=51511 RepID=H2Y617_CIOSA